jgi:hypothetical protein
MFHSLYMIGILTFAHSWRKVWPMSISNSMREEFASNVEMLRARSRILRSPDLKRKEKPARGQRLAFPNSNSHGGRRQILELLVKACGKFSRIKHP